MGALSFSRALSRDGPLDDRRSRDVDGKETAEKAMQLDWLTARWHSKEMVGIQQDQQ